jgi:hypothetical protein
MFTVQKNCKEIKIFRVTLFLLVLIHPVLFHAILIKQYKSLVEAGLNIIVECNIIAFLVVRIEKEGNVLNSSQHHLTSSMLTELRLHDGKIIIKAAPIASSRLL